MQKFYPKGRRLPALERAILKYRAFQMMIILFHIEDLKSFILEAIRASNKRCLPEGTKNLYKKMWAIVVSEGILSQGESDDLQNIIDYRNQIAHHIQELTFDISRDKCATGHFDLKGSQYDYSALERLEHYREQIHCKMEQRFVIPLGFDSLLFASAEKTYRQEMKRLERVIERLMNKRKEENAALKAELESVDKQILEEIHPGYPDKVLRNGRLSQKGIDCCQSLFQQGLSDLAISYLMRISHASIRRRRKRWAT